MTEEAIAQILNLFTEEGNHIFTLNVKRSHFCISTKNTMQKIRLNSKMCILNKIRANAAICQQVLEYPQWNGMKQEFF